MVKGAPATSWGHRSETLEGQGNTEPGMMFPVTRMLGLSVSVLSVTPVRQCQNPELSDRERWFERQGNGLEVAWECNENPRFLNLSPES